MDWSQREAFLDAWWKQFRYIKKEEAIHVIDATRLKVHPYYDQRVPDEVFFKYILPILHTRKLWNKAHLNLKSNIHRCIMDARVELIEKKLAKVPLDKDIHVG